MIRYVLSCALGTFVATPLAQYIYVIKRLENVEEQEINTECIINEVQENGWRGK